MNSLGIATGKENSRIVHKAPPLVYKHCLRMLSARQPSLEENVSNFQVWEHSLRCLGGAHDAAKRARRQFSCLRDSCHGPFSSHDPPAFQRYDSTALYYTITSGSTPTYARAMSKVRESFPGFIP